MAEENTLSLTLQRIIAAPRALVFRLWTDGDHVRRWCAPSGFAVVEGSADLRPGGEWATTLRDPTGREWRLRGA
ncbi:MAG: SRPBCC domain-containing protein [Alphaproteobacteria bacterium]